MRQITTPRENTNGAPPPKPLSQSRHPGIMGTPPSTRISRAISRRNRAPMRKALVVGCTYQGHLDYENRIEPLLGSSNDAYAFAIALTNLWDFHPNDICLLTDALPSSCYSANSEKSVKLDGFGMPLEPQAIPRDGRRSDEGTQAALPTRHNILMGLKWLMGDAVDGDVIVFFFAGYGVQIDNMSGWLGEGYDEAIVPLDYRQLNGEINPISTTHIREQLTGTSQAKVQLSVFMDCCGVQSLLDPCGTGKSWPNHHIKGAKTKGIWPISNVSDKVQRAEYKTNIMRDAQLYDRYARPRYIPGEEVSNTQELRDFSLQITGSGDNINMTGFQFSAAEWSSLAIEVCLPSIGIRGYDHNGINKSQRSSTATVPQIPVLHGVFTYSLIHAMQHCIHNSLKQKNQKKVTYMQLMTELSDRFAMLKKNTLHALDQTPSMTVYSQGKSDAEKEFVFWPETGVVPRRRYNSITPDKVKASPIPYIPDDRQWMNVHICQNIIIYWESKRRTVSSISSPIINNSQIRTPPHPHENATHWRSPKIVPNANTRFLDKDPEPGDGTFESGVFSVKKSRGLCQLEG